jgi:putative MATE family efflux protein
VAIPAVLANLALTAFHNVDTFWIGRFLGPDALAAATASVFWVWLAIAIAELVSIGLDAVAARRHGERLPAEAARAVGDGLLLAVALGLAVAVASRWVLDALFGAMGTGAEVAALGSRYLGVYFAAVPLLFASFAVDAAFRASGDTRTPMRIVTAALLVGLALDPVLILGLGPVPALGIAGAALATVLPRGVASLVGVVMLHRRGLVRFGRPRAAVLGRIVRIGGPAAATGVAFSAIYVVLTRTTTQFGTPALAALGLGFRIESVVYVVAVGVGLAVAAVVGQSLGAGDAPRATRAGWIGAGLVSALGGVMAVASFVFAEELAGLFSRDAAVIAEAARYLRIAAFSQLFLGAEVVLESAMGGAGWTVWPMALSTGITALRVPVGAWAAAQWGTTGLWWTLAVTAAARGVVMAGLWGLGRWWRGEA